MSSRRHVRYSPFVADEDDGYDGNGGRRYDPRLDYSPKAFDEVHCPFSLFALSWMLASFSFVFHPHWAYGRREIAGLWPFSPQNSCFPSR
ncbi:hypothetical protein CRYUN_Cryun24cG0098400 [Craigia yunnanensis]